MGLLQRRVQSNRVERRSEPIMGLRIVFMGSPEFSLPSLQKVAENYCVVGVVTQPDRPAGRGRRLSPPPVKTLAQKFDIPIIQPFKLTYPEAIEEIRAWKPDLIVVAAFGQLLSSEVLNLPRYGCLNVHASLLPRWRGAAPIQAAILHGDEQTGVTIMCMDSGMDTGPILSQSAISIHSEENGGQLGERLAILGAELLIKSSPGYLIGEVKPQSQDESKATYAPRLKKQDGELDFTQPAASLALRVRAFNPWPGAYTIWQNQVLKIHRASPIQDAKIEKTISPGQHKIYNGLPAICTGQGLLLLNEVQLAGKKSMDGKTFLQGAKSWV